MPYIADAIRYYQMRHKAPPNSLSNLVSEGLLPEVSNLYAASIVQLKLRPEPIRFELADYEIVPFTNGATVRLKPELLRELKRNGKLDNDVLDSFFSIFVHLEERIGN
jgi:hypothetical protein